MILEIVILILSMLLIVGSSELFTNGIEWLGQRLNINEGVVGSVLAAIGTALPETLVPVVAVISFGQRQGNEVSVGAITGSPFMLSTLTLGLCGLFVYIFAKKGIRSYDLKLDTRVLKRDLRFFVFAFSLVLVGAFFADQPVVRLYLGCFIFLVYPVYLYFSLKADGIVGEPPDTLYFARLSGFESRGLFVILLQVVVSVLGITCGAYYFVNQIQDIGMALGFPIQVLSIIVSPIATEFPEKMNSILWLRKGKDTLALGNVTGALVFQSTILGGFGVALTKWNLSLDARIGACVALVSTIAVLTLLGMDKLSYKALCAGIVLYAICISFFLFGINS